MLLLCVCYEGIFAIARLSSWATRQKLHTLRVTVAHICWKIELIGHPSADQSAEGWEVRRGAAKENLGPECSLLKRRRQSGKCRRKKREVRETATDGEQVQIDREPERRKGWRKGSHRAAMSSL